MKTGSYIETTIDKWEDIFKLNKSFTKSFIFRGQANSDWDLKTSIERAKLLSKFNYSSDYNTEEKWMIHEFKKKFHLHSNRHINSTDKFEWLSVMQHHGAPTRLLDFTSSIFIASYFSVIESNTESSVWAVNKFILRDTLLKDFKLNYILYKDLKDKVELIHREFANNFIAIDFEDRSKTPSTIIPLEPSLNSERLSRQKGLFLMPTNSEKSFMKNLESIFKRENSNFEELTFDELIDVSEEGIGTKLQVIKINIPKDMHIDILDYLNDMNITSETLFPGLDGLAKSLFHTQLRI